MVYIIHWALRSILIIGYYSITRLEFDYLSSLNVELRFNSFDITGFYFAFLIKSSLYAIT